MFHKRYRRLWHVSWREKWQLTKTLENHESGLTTKFQEASERCGYGFQPTSSERKHFEAVAGTLKAAHEREPLAIFALRLAESCLFLERYVEAVEILEKATEEAPTDIRLAYALSTVYRALGRPRQQEAELMYARQMLEAPPDQLRHRLVASRAIEDACSRLGLTADDARRLTAEHLSRVLVLDVHPSDRSHVEETLQIDQQFFKGEFAR